MNLSAGRNPATGGVVPATGAITGVSSMLNAVCFDCYGVPMQHGAVGFANAFFRLGSSLLAD